MLHFSLPVNKQGNKRQLVIDMKNQAYETGYNLFVGGGTHLKSYLDYQNLIDELKHNGFVKI